MKMRNWFRVDRATQSVPRSPRAMTKRRRGCRLEVEGLEDRSVPTASISIGDSIVKEQGNLSVFVPGDAAILEHPSGIVFGPDRSNDGVQDLYTVGRVSKNIVVYDGGTGAFVEQFASASAGFSFPTFGPDNALYTSTSSSPTPGLRDTILRIDQSKNVTAFISPNNPGGNGGLVNARSMLFGPDGNFYVADHDTDQVLRYNGSTGAFIDAFVTAGSGGLNGPIGMQLGPDRDGDSVSDIYLGSELTDQVLVYSGLNGAFQGVFVSAASGGLDAPHNMQFGKDGNLYVVSPPTSYDQVLRFDGATGSFIDIPITTGSGIGPETAFIAFDQQGDLYVGSEYANEILRNSAGPLVNLSEPALTPITVEFSTASGTAFQGSDYAGVSGKLTFAPGETSKRILVSTVDDGVNELSESFSINLSNSDGATIADGQGVVTILNTQTTFFVVDDGATAPTGPNVSDKTYDYESGGASVVSNVLTFANTAPRGVASNLAGTRLWVIDANKSVYVYDNRNALLGSWSAGSLAGTAQVEGIATNGTDVWIVDAKQDKVYRYAGAASRLSGSQNSASSFSLNSGNKNPKDIVTDGNSIWVVNDSTTDKVFKYTLSGTYLGSWTIDPANGSPTGITINPANVSDIWIVDNGTDKVYQYTNAASRTSGSQLASATFSLAPGNTNQQGIADPPPPELMESSAAEDVVAVADDDTGVPSPQSRRAWALSLRTWIKGIGRR